MEQATFFQKMRVQPLADRMRPRDFGEFVGQRHLVGEGKILRRMIEGDEIPSMIFYGPPGVGKTTLARIIANRTKSAFIDFSAVTSGIREIREVMTRAEEGARFGDRTILFVDEIHRFNKAQQDAFLPFVEKGSITLIGATTENPSFEVNGALLSRCRVFLLKPLTEDDLVQLIRQALTDPRAFDGRRIDMDEAEIRALAVFANGDARTALSVLEMAVLNSPEEGDGVHVTREVLSECTSRRSLLYDKKGEEHYNLISALHKSMRNSDADAAVYWLARMLESGEDPLYIARRMVRFASEDVGLADPRALEITVAAFQACHFIGMPECSVHLTQAAVYLSLAPKSNALDAAYHRAKEDALSSLAEPVPMQLRNAETNLMRSFGYGKGYVYAHDTAEKMARMTCLPESLKDRRYYLPGDQGLEGRFAQRLEEILQWKKGKE